jgi:GT2 family glycosyltransferase
LDSLKEQTYKNFEILIIDNGSVDDSVNSVEADYPQLNLRIKRLDKNTGFAYANNFGAQMARGKWLALLNADAFPEPDWLENLMAAASQYPNASFSSRQIQANNPEFLDGEGDLYRITGFAKRRSYNTPVYSADENLVEIFSPCAAAALYPRQAFLDAGGFDEDFFSYYEDVDLGFRLRLYGLASYYVPHAVVHHIGSASTGKMSDFSVYYEQRNLLWTYLKNMPSVLLWFSLPFHIVLSLAFFFKRTPRIVWKAKLDAIRHLGKVIAKRKKIQKERQTSTREIFRLLNKRVV